MADLALQAETPASQLHPDAPAVRVEHVSIGFEGKEVLEDISFVVHRGETRILLGPAGVGKSVLLKLANGLLKPDSGSIFVFGYEVSAMREEDLFQLRESIGTVFQEGALFDSLTVRDNVGYRLMEQHLPDTEIDQQVTEALRFVELEHTLAKFPSELSGGMRRRVAIARAIITKPDLILYDSPTGGLDPITSTTIVELVIKQRDVTQTTSLVITHRIQDAYLLARSRFNTETGKVEQIPNNGIDDSTKFLVLNEGKVVFDGTTEELVHSDDPWLKEYLS